MLFWLVALLFALVGLFFFLTGDSSAMSGIDTTERWVLIGALALTSLYALTLMAGYRGRIGTAIRHIGIWLAIFAVLVALYAFRDDFARIGDRMAGELLPPGYGTSSQDAQSGETSVRIRKRRDGHFVARTRVNDAAVTMLVDTGASTVVLKPADAQAAGINTASLNFTVPVRTANGTTFAAPVRLRALTVGGIVVDDIEALVAKPGNLNVSLLGMSFLRRLRSYEFTGDFLTLRS